MSGLQLGIVHGVDRDGSGAAAIIGEPALEALRIAWGPDVEIAAAACLSRRLSPVCRLELKGGDAPASVILKQMWPEQIAAGAPVATNPFFVAECIANQFLSEIGAEPGLKPMIYAADTRGIMLMEDLGRENYATMPTYASLCDPLARSLARLHARAQRHLDRYRALVDRSGLSAPGMDRRDCIQAVQHAEAARAVDYLTRSAAQDGIDPDPLRAELAEAIALIAAPGPFETLIHDDLAHGRQTFLRDGTLLLIDFEHAQIGHALIDLARVVLGKMEAEMVSSERRQIWISANFPLILADRYRAILAREFDLRFDDEVWRSHLAAALVFGTLQVIGYAESRVARQRHMVGSLRQNINGLLYRLATLLDGFPVFPALQAFMLRFLCIPSLGWVREATQMSTAAIGRSVPRVPSPVQRREAF